MSTGRLFLIPTVIADDTHKQVIPPHVISILPTIQYFLVENVRTARRFLSSLKVYEKIDELQFEVLNKDTNAAELKALFLPVFAGQSVGVMSESGCPGVADPGALAVKYAHDHDIEVIPLVGPSSVLLALMSSGLNGQRFAFHGYLPIAAPDLTREIKALEKESRMRNQTQIFIETPYRNNNMMNTLLRTLHSDTHLSVALDLTGQNQSVKTFTVQKWREVKIEFPKLPAVFLFLAS